MRELVPGKKQWTTWALPSRLTALGTLFGALSLVLSVAFFGVSQLEEKNSRALERAQALPSSVPEAAHVAVKERLRSSVLELANSEEYYETTFTRTFTREFFATSAFQFKSTAELRISAKGAVRAGYDAAGPWNLAIDHSKRRLVVMLPEPRIFSSDIDFEFIQDEDGIFAQITPQVRTQALRDARAQIERRAVQEGLLERLKGRAEALVEITCRDISHLSGEGYGVETRFGPRVD